MASCFNIFSIYSFATVLKFDALVVKFSSKKVTTLEIRTISQKSRLVNEQPKNQNGQAHEQCEYIGNPCSTEFIWNSDP